VSDAILSYELRGKTALLRMDDGKANALSDAMIESLVGALARAESEASAIVLTGRPDRFSAGFDLKVMMSGPDAARGLLRRGSALFMKLYTTPLPLVIAATGHALAGGALTVLTGDHRIAADGAYKIGLNEVAIGLPVPILAMELARARLAASELTQATLGGRIYTPTEALAAGYVDEVVDAASLEPRALERAAKLGELSRSAYAATKRRLRELVVGRIESTLDQDLTELLGG
jgi:enoyl-CoA hydratase